MLPDQRSDPRDRGAGPGANVTRGAGRKRQSTGSMRPGRGRFVLAHDWTVAEIESALATADVEQLIAALDRHPDAPTSRCDCPACGSLRSVSGLGRWHWSCESCGALGSWMALRQPCAMSVESVLRLAEIVKVSHPARGAA